MLRESVKIPGHADVWVRRAENVNVLKQQILILVGEDLFFFPMFELEKEKG